MGSSKKHKSDKDKEERKHKHKRDKVDKEKDRSSSAAAADSNKHDKHDKHDKDRSEKEGQERREKRRHKHRHRRSRSRSPQADRNESEKRDRRERKRKHRTRERSSSGSDGADAPAVEPSFVDEVFQLVKEEIGEGGSKANPSLDTTGHAGKLGTDHSVKKEKANSEATESSGSGYVQSLSIDGTNKIRAKLGLPPLKVGGGEGKAAEGGEPAKDEDQDVHKPAINLMEKKKAEELKAKLALIKEKRKINQKLKKVKKLANDNDDDMDDVTAWVERSRKSQIEKEMAAKRAKMLEEMDEEFGIGALVEDEFTSKREDVYSSKHIRDLKVLHSVGSFREGRNVILTLRDADVLGEDEDELMNVNIIDDEKAAKNVELRKKKKDYKPYADDTIDEYGMVKATNVLSKYDEEIEGAKVESFRLGGRNAVYDNEEERLERIRANLRAQAVTLEFKAPRLASEYYTASEMEAFKKPKKKKRKIKRKFTVDDLTPDDKDVFEDHGSRGRVRQRPSDDSIPDKRESRSTEGPGAYQESVDMDVDLPDVDGTAIMGPDEDDFDLGPPIEDEAEQELQNVLSKARKLKQKKNRNQPKVEEKIAEEVAKIKEEPVEMHSAEPEGIQESYLGLSEPAALKGLNITLNSTSEFCRTLGEIPTYGMAGNREDDEEDMVDIDQDVRDAENLGEDGGQEGWSTVNLEKEDDQLPRDIAGPVLEEEPTVQTGISGALNLAMKKGYLEQEFIKATHKSKKGEDLEAKNFTVEDKNYNDIDAKYNKHDRYRGPLADFKEKDTYKPDVQLRYVDDHGREINQKEAFRLLSHRFHGKGSGKMKTDKRAKKLMEEEAMKKMSSTDTPLNTVSMMKLKQKQTQSPFILLSGGSKSLTANSLAK